MHGYFLVLLHKQWHMTPCLALHIKSRSTPRRKLAQAEQLLSRLLLALTQRRHDGSSAPHGCCLESISRSVVLAAFTEMSTLGCPKELDPMGHGPHDAVNVMSWQIHCCAAQALTVSIAR